MSFTDAVRSVLSQYATFTGRARRSEFWFFYLFSFLLSVDAAVVDQVLDMANAYGGVVGTLVSLALLVPSLAVGARRLHDTGRSGWMQLIALIPLIGIIVLIVFWCQNSVAGENKHGPSPKASGRLGAASGDRLVVSRRGATAATADRDLPPFTETRTAGGFRTYTAATHNADKQREKQLEHNAQQSRVCPSDRRPVVLHGVQQ